MSNFISYLLIGSLLVITSCGTEEPAREKPADLLSREKFVEVFAHTQILDAAYKQKVFKHKDTKEYLGQQYVRLFAEQGVNREDFIATYTWYSSDPGVMVGVYDEVLEKITAIEAQLTEQEKQDQ